MVTGRREVDPEDRWRARFKLTTAGKKIDRERRGTVEAATRRALGRVKPTDVETTLDLVAKLVEELVRPD